jgi:hypothetical protein
VEVALEEGVAHEDDAVAVDELERLPGAGNQQQAEEKESDHGGDTPS